MKVIMDFSGHNIGFQFKEGRQVLQWQNMTEEQQRAILNGFVEGYTLFKRFYKGDLK